MANIANEERSLKDSHFWQPPLWKWGVLLVLSGCAVFLLVWKPATHAAKVELLPFTDSPPAWNGAYRL